MMNGGKRFCISSYTHLTAGERDQIADLKGGGFSIWAIASTFRRAGPTISRELKRNALASGAYCPVPTEGAYLLRRQRPARLEKDGKLRGYVLGLGPIKGISKFAEI